MISTFMSAQHRHCDALFSEFEACVEQSNWSQAERLYQAFQEETLSHFQLEENQLFPAFEQATGMARSQGPTGVMVMEHQQIRDLMEQISKALATREADRILDLADTLMITLGQHNMKEEQVLYTLCDQKLPQDLLTSSEP